MWVVVGLGNPGEEYAKTRHNVGRIVLSHFLKADAFPQMAESNKYASLVAEGRVGKEKVLVMFPETYMNKSGSAVQKVVTSAKQAQKLIVIYDDIDLPLGKVRISFGRGSGGHRGVESIIRSIRTKDFVRVRIGVAPTTPTGKIKKPKGEQNVLNFLMGDFKPKEHDAVKHVSKTVTGAVEAIVREGTMTAMNKYN